MLETVENLNNQAVRLAADGSFQEAIACFVRAITIEKDNYLLWFNLGITYRDAGRLKEAKAALLQAHEISEQDEDIIESLALICYNMGDFEEALAYCGEGLDYNPQNPHLWNTAGVVYFNQNEYGDAAQAFENAVMMNPYYYDALFNLRDAYEKMGNAAGYHECDVRIREIEKHREPK
ncbi:MAG: tetratricopeptide repeat protein [Treponemataceae bacterium]|nr:tetratricopeptide repeat protein [Treponemataceae bacterium]